MNRTEFQQLADVRVAEAAALLTAGLWDGAYYLAGYAVECGLKACIAKQTKAEDFPPDKEKVGKIYSHNFGALVPAAGLQSALIAERQASTAFDDNWTIAAKWSEQSRY